LARGRRTLKYEEVLAALGFPLEAEQVLQNPPAVLAATVSGGLVPAALRVQLDLCQDADQQLVHVMGQAGRGLDELATAAVGQTATDCRQKSCLCDRLLIAPCFRSVCMRACEMCARFARNALLEIL